MTRPEENSPREVESAALDSLNSDVVEVTQVEVDNTVRPMRESLRQRLKSPSTLPTPPEPRREKQSP